MTDLSAVQVGSENIHIGKSLRIVQNRVRQILQVLK